MTRPKNNKKGRTLKMPETPWALRFIDYEQTANECNRIIDADIHSEECDGNCARVQLLESEVDLHNEVVFWNKHEWRIQGIPDSFMGGPVPGIGVNLLRVDWVQQALIQYLLDEGIIDEDKLNEKFRQIKLEVLQNMRREQEAKMNAPEIAVPDKRLLGPNGEVLH